MAALTAKQAVVLETIPFGWTPGPTMTNRQLDALPALVDAGVVEKKFADWTETRRLVSGEIRIELRACWHYRRVC